MKHSFSTKSNSSKILPSPNYRFNSIPHIEKVGDFSKNNICFEFIFKYKVYYIKKLSYKYKILYFRKYSMIW